MSSILFKSARYTVCVINAGLTVQSNKTSKGVILKKDHPQFIEWFAAFNTAVDAEESNALAKALIN